MNTPKPLVDETELSRILIEYDMGKIPLFPGDPTAEKAIANRDKAQTARDYAILRIEAFITSDKQRLLQELMEQAEYQQCRNCKGAHLLKVVPLSVIQNKLEGLER